MNLIKNGTAGYLNTVGEVIMYTLILNMTYREYRDNSCIAIFSSYHIVTLKFQYCPALGTKGPKFLPQTLKHIKPKYKNHLYSVAI